MTMPKINTFWCSFRICLQKNEAMFFFFSQLENVSITKTIKRSVFQAHESEAHFTPTVRWCIFRLHFCDMEQYALFFLLIVHYVQAHTDGILTMQRKKNSEKTFISFVYVILCPYLFTKESSNVFFFSFGECEFYRNNQALCVPSICHKPTIKRCIFRLLLCAMKKYALFLLQIVDCGNVIHLPIWTI